MTQPGMQVSRAQRLATGWLDPLRHALAQSRIPVNFFFRDDDVGWESNRLRALLDLFAKHELPIDLAVIPATLGGSLARELRAHAEQRPGLIALHQHGFTHVNHEPEGRKCEFGPARSRAQQYRDIESGKRKLAELLGPSVSPIFTPPWNRCTATTGEIMVDLEFRILSRDASAPPLQISGLLELAVCFDWFAKRKGVRLSRDEAGAVLAAKATPDAPVGIMFHHALMGQEERTAAGELLRLLAAHDNARCWLMNSLASGAGRRAKSAT